MMKILTILGARPQFIKASAISREILKHEGLEEIIVHTGQHFDPNMSEIFFKEMNIPEPKYNLNINSGSHGFMTGRMIEGIEKVLMLEKPDLVIVYGDTDSTLSGAVAAAKLHIQIAHVEAGLRSYNMEMPEEVNRVLTDRLSKLLFCPTERAVKNLDSEGYRNFDCSIFLSGDVMYDNAIYFSGMASHLPLHPYADKYSGEYLLCTFHRAENTNSPENLANLVKILNDLGKQYRILLPVHPRTQKVLRSLNFKFSFDTIDPVGYLEMLNLIQHCRLVITDSGGLQKEASFFRKFCITVREQTEWTELVENKINVLTGTDELKITAALKLFSGSEFPADVNFYGDGKAACKIIGHILESSN